MIRSEVRKKLFTYMERRQKAQGLRRTVKLPLTGGNVVYLNEWLGLRFG